MFTGIIEEIGLVEKIDIRASDALIKIACTKVLEDVKLGDSIAINGVCQTVVDFSATHFSAEVSLETLNVTNFSKLKSGNKVNLERAMLANSRFGGHIVSGHVDSTAKLKNIKKLSEFYVLEFDIEKGREKYIVDKGSVTINGISLTVAKCSTNSFELAIIPHTFENTNLSELKIGDIVNLECDILAKYVEKILLTKDNVSRLDENFLKENGFM